MTYTLPSSAFPEERTRLLRRYYSAYLITVLAAASLILPSLDFRPGFPMLSSIFTLSSVVTVSVGVAFAVIFRSMNMRRAWWDGYRLELGTDRVRVRFYDGGGVELRREQVTGFTETLERGLLVKTRDAARFIVIPRALNGYDEVRQRLASWRPMPKLSTREPIWQSPLVIGSACVVLWVALWQSWNTPLVASSAFLLMTFLISSFVFVVRSPHSSVAAKRLSWTYLAMAAVALIKVYQVLQIPSWYK